MASKIIGQDGKPIELEKLEEDIDLGGLTSIRQVWHSSAARGLTPAKLADMLERAGQGDADDYLTLAEEMEERDPHYAAVLSVRKRAVAGLPRIVEENNAKPEHAQFVRDVIAKPEVNVLIDELLDAMGKAYSVNAIQWSRGKSMLPLNYPHMDPRWFRYDDVTGRQLLLRSNDAPNGAPMTPYAYIVHQPRMKTGLQIRNGLARLVAFAWLCKSYALKDWVAFVEIYGQPLRVGVFGPNATNEDKAVLRRAVQSIGTDAAALISESLKLEFHELKNSGAGAEIYQKLCEFIDKQISKAVLGQTMTTDAQSAGMGSGQANVQNEVRGDLMTADAFDLGETLNRDLVRPLIDLNFGPQEHYPRLVLQIADPEDLKLLSESLPAMVKVGMRVPEAWARAKFGVPEAGKDDVLLTSETTASVFTAAPALNHRRRVALNAATQLSADDQIDTIREVDLDGWQEQIDPIVKAVQTLAEGAGTIEELLAKLPDVLSNVAPDALVRALAIAAMKARGIGDVQDQPGLV